MEKNASAETLFGKKSFRTLPKTLAGNPAPHGAVWPVA
jgi:hypothetical protein